MHSAFHTATRVIQLPQLRADIASFEFIADLSNMLISGTSTKNVIVDFSQAVWMDAHMLAPLGACFYSHTRRGGGVKFVNVPIQIEALIRKNGFLSAFQDEMRTPDKWGTIIPYRRYLPSDEKTFPTYMSRISRGRGTLKFNDTAKISLLLTTVELFNNAISHGRSGFGVFVCGQYYPNANKMRFAIADLGVGIENNVSGFLGAGINGLEAIQWSMERGNSTRVGRPGGMGLYFLKNFALSNGGSLSIISGDSTVTYGREEHMTNTKKYYSGTYICLEINTNSPSKYIPDYGGEIDDDLF
jgi:anti-anti-sigma regulatory factor